MSTTRKMNKSVYDSSLIWLRLAYPLSMTIQFRKNGSAAIKAPVAKEDAIVVRN